MLKLSNFFVWKYVSFFPTFPSLQYKTNINLFAMKFPKSRETIEIWTATRKWFGRKLKIKFLVHN